MAKTQTKVGIKPLGDRVLIQRLEAEEKTSGGIVLPDSAKEKPKEGIVLALGPGKLLEDGKRSTFSVATGNRVIFSSYAGTEVKWQGEEYLLMSEEDILAVVES
ncbi:MAG: co-chaperone GroES [Planctomycetes bacterium]|jgi:chaperonin GroES|nr:co-chaperone GroES [Planctomycetota bacterium]MBL8900273.1 co-chaperone GroES [Planctomycetota bacterium]